MKQINKIEWKKSLKQSGIKKKSGIEYSQLALSQQYPLFYGSYCITHNRSSKCRMCFGTRGLPDSKIRVARIINN